MDKLITVDGNTYNINSGTGKYTIGHGTGINEYTTGWPVYKQPEVIWEYKESPSWEEIRKILDEEDGFRDKISKKNERSETMEDKNRMYVYDVVIFDKKECEIISQQKVIAENTETAMLELALEDETKKKVKKGTIGFVFTELANFQKIEEEEKK